MISMLWTKRPETKSEKSVKNLYKKWNLYHLLVVLPSNVLKEKATQLWRKEAEIPQSYSQTYPASEFLILLFPRFKIQKWWRQFRPQKNNQFLGTMEDERMAEKIRDPEAYYRKWGKTPQTQLENQLNKNKREKVYWMVGCGILFVSLVVLVIKIIKIRKNKS